MQLGTRRHVVASEQFALRQSPRTLPAIQADAPGNHPLKCYVEERRYLRIENDQVEAAFDMHNGQLITLRYDGVEETYFLNRPTAAHPDIPETREVGPIPFLLGRNVTSRYQADYPGVGTVVYALSGYVRH